MSKSALRIVGAAVLVGLLILGGCYAWIHYRGMVSPHFTLKIATGPAGSDGQKIIGAFLRDVASEHRFVRLQPVETTDLAESAKALLDGRADVAEVRSDNAAALQGRTVFILRKIALAVLLPPKSAIEDVHGLVGKKVGLVNSASADDPLLQKFAEFYGLRHADVVPLAVEEVGPALRHGSIVAALVLGPIGPGAIVDTFATVRKALKTPPKFLDIGEATAIAARFPEYDAAEIPQGSFGGSPAEPAETINTVAASVRLVSRASLPNRFAGEITRLLLVTKRQLFATVPAAAQMEAPEADKTAVLPVHAGTQAYLNGEQPSLLDETLNLYWYAGMAAAILGPALGWMITVARRRRDSEVRSQLLRACELLAIARTGSPEEINKADEQLEELLERLFHLTAHEGLEREQFHCQERMLSQVRATIERRRQAQQA